MDCWRQLRQAIGTETIILPSAAGAIVQDGKILLVRHGELQKWHIPGGGQGLDESIQDTVCREIKDELGLGYCPDIWWVSMRSCPPPTIRAVPKHRPERKFAILENAVWDGAP